MALLLLCSLVMLFVASWVYSFWVNMSIPFYLSLLLFVYISIFNWNNMFAYFVNGMGKIRLQLYCSVISGGIFYSFGNTIRAIVGACWYYWIYVFFFVGFGCTYANTIETIIGKECHWNLE